MEKKKILMVLTNVAKCNDNKRATGLWLGEATHFYDVVKKAGYEVDFVSPNGNYVPIDLHSLKYADTIDYQYYTDHDFQTRALSQSLNPSQIETKNYAAIYYTGGHGVIWDFPENEQLQKIAWEIYQNNGYITSVCHGAVGLLNIKDDAGKYLITGKTVTGFTDMEEKLNRTNKQVPYSTEQELKKRGANFVKKRFFSEHAILDGRVITGQNPQSPKAVAKLLIGELNKLSEY